MYINEIEETRTETINETEYLVAPVVPIKAMNLDRGYVPAEEIRRSQRAWNGTTVTLNHPHNTEGKVVSANSPEMAEKTWLGYLFNVDSEDGGEKLNGEIWIDKQNANSIGGDAQRIVDELEDGEPVSVSTSYFGDRLQPGSYDGEFRDRVIGNLRPDHLAVLSSKKGKCSIDDGCMAGEPAANDMELVINRTVAGVEFTGTRGGKLDESEIDKEEQTLSDHYLFGSGDDKGDFSYPVVDADGFLRKGNVEAAFQVGASGEGVTESELHSKLRKLNDEWSEGSQPIDPEKLSGNTDDPGNSGEDSVDEGVSENGESSNGDINEDSTMEREKYINFLVENYDFEEDSLEGMGDSCLERTYESFNDEGDGEQVANDDDSGVVEQKIDNLIESVDSLEQRVNSVESGALMAENAEDLFAEAEAERRKQEIRDTIVANSEKWESGQLENLGKEALENIEDDVTGRSANYSAQIPGTPKKSTNESEEFPSLSVGAREKQLEGDD